MLRIRLCRVGGTNAPAYRIVVSDSRKTPKSQVVAELGHYDPTKNPASLVLDAAKARGWIAKGARATDTVAALLAKVEKPAPAPAA